MGDARCGKHKLLGNKQIEPVSAYTLTAPTQRRAPQLPHLLAKTRQRNVVPSHTVVVVVTDKLTAELLPLPRDRSVTMAGTPLPSRFQTASQAFARGLPTTVIPARPSPSLHPLGSLPRLRGLPHYYGRVRLPASIDCSVLRSSLAHRRPLPLWGSLGLSCSVCLLEASI